MKAITPIEVLAEPAIGTLSHVLLLNRYRKKDPLTIILFVVRIAEFENQGSY